MAELRYGTAGNMTDAPKSIRTTAQVKARAAQVLAVWERQLDVDSVEIGDVRRILRAGSWSSTRDWTTFKFTDLRTGLVAVLEVRG